MGLGTVGRWVLDALSAHRERLSGQLGADLRIVAVANRSDGFLHSADGFDLNRVRRPLDRGDPMTDLDADDRWELAAEGIDATDADIVVEVSKSPSEDGEPGLSHMRRALGSGASVVTSNKWPVALEGVELARLARSSGAVFRAESTVMSGTPVLGPLTEVAGATPVGLRGVLNATVNEICTLVSEGVPYADALERAKAAGLAEPDPAEDVDGLDSAAKLMILSALIFGEQLTLADADVRGISAIAGDEIAAAAQRGARLREVATLAPRDGIRSVGVTEVRADDPLFAVTGTTNAVLARFDPLGEIAIRGPGAGPQIAGQGVFSDLVATALELSRTR